ncbi:hypothetical protein M3201_07785 [Paenibacillus motobuensis]|uniref:DapH/DapD/GlmU-related protein n=1 Tax=Paenibacillus TaxID=44249 RepID=UPI00203AE779|nr:MULTISPECIES: DapH/DapD/GlmU-related protein [Paenibacillus]MCM3039598.1 hypothetical protein [Paenibacillus lutimineralis]MCM3646702.1 hypothetical protein [Paenibacillus motobuensis]
MLSDSNGSISDDIIKLTYGTTNLLDVLIKRLLKISNFVTLLGTEHSIKNQELELNERTQVIHNLSELISNSHTPESEKLLILDINQLLLKEYYLKEISSLIESNYSVYIPSQTHTHFTLGITLKDLVDLQRVPRITQDILEQIEIIHQFEIPPTDLTFSHITDENLPEIILLQQKRYVEELRQQGIIFQNPESVEIDSSAILMPGCIIGSFCVIKGSSFIEEGAEIGSFTTIDNSYVGKNTRVISSLIVNSKLENNTIVGPFSYIRGKSTIKEEAQVGSFSEINDTVLGVGSKSKHFSYIGHTEVGESVNIGAGTITCTYDGKNKHNLKIGDNAFLGSGTLLVAPVSLGDYAKTGAGTVVTKNIPDEVLVYGNPGRIIKKIDKEMNKDGG